MNLNVTKKIIPCLCSEYISKDLNMLESIIKIISIEKKWVWTNAKYGSNKDINKVA